MLVPLVFSADEMQSRGTYYANSVLGRLAPDATLDSARAEAATLVGTAWAQYPAEVRAALKNTEISWLVNPYRDAVSGRSRLLVLVLFGTVLLLLLAGCTNLGSLLLALTTSRQRELAVRASLGAGRLRLARQLLAESVLLAGLGGVLGLGVAWLLVRAAPMLLPATMPRIDQVTIDLRVVLFTMAAALVTALLFGLAPAWRWSLVAPGLGPRRRRRPRIDQRGRRRASGGDWRWRSAPLPCCCWCRRCCSGARSSSCSRARPASTPSAR